MLGTLITNFVGPVNLAEEISTICTVNILENHPLGRQALSCVWILVFAVLRTAAEQLNFAFEIFDPTDPAPSVYTLPHQTSLFLLLNHTQFPTIPQIDGLPGILEKANRLSRIDRYLSSLEELSSFFRSVHDLFEAESGFSKLTPQASSSFLSKRVILLRKLEAEKMKNKILHEQRLCETYTKQFDTLVQMVIPKHSGRAVFPVLNKSGHFPSRHPHHISPRARQQPGRAVHKAGHSHRCYHWRHSPSQLANQLLRHERAGVFLRGYRFAF